MDRMSQRLRWLTVAVMAMGMLRGEAGIVVGPPSSAPPPSGSNIATPVETGAVARAEVRPPNDRLVLVGGEWLSGSLIGASAQSGELVWRHPAMRDPLAVRLSAVSEVLLGRPASAARSAADGVVRLTNGDELRGRVRILDAEAMNLDDTPAGSLRLQRAMIAEFSPSGGAGEVFYEGPVSLDEWSLRGDRSRQWAFIDGGLVPLNPSPLGRVIENMGDRVRIEFTIEWKFGPGYLSFWFFHEKPEEPQGDAYMLNIVASQRLDLNRMRVGGGGQSLGGVEIGEMTGGGGAMRVVIYADRRQGEIAVSINGRLVRQWKDSRDFKGTGRAITFMPQGGRDVRLTDIRVSRWTGRLPQATDAAEKTDSDTVLLANGDTMSGRVLDLREGRLRVETPFAPFEVPADRVMLVSLAGDTRLRARRRANDVRLRLAGGGQVTMTLLEMDGTTLRGESENFGRVEWPLAAVQRIEFNLYGDHAQRSMP